MHYNRICHHGEASEFFERNNLVFYYFRGMELRACMTTRFQVQQGPHWQEIGLVIPVT